MTDIQEDNFGEGLGYFNPFAAGSRTRLNRPSTASEPEPVKATPTVSTVPEPRVIKKLGDFTPQTENAFGVVAEPVLRVTLSSKEQKEKDKHRVRGKLRMHGFTNDQLDQTADVIPEGELHQEVMRQQEDEVSIEGLPSSLKTKRYQEFAHAGFCSEIMETLKKRDFKKPTIIQQYCFPAILKTERHLCVRSQTGSGKTAAFMLPMIQLIHNDKLRQVENRNVNSKAPYAVVFSPTRELAIQLAKDATILTKHTLVRVAFCIGELNLQDSMKVFRNGVDIVVGTIGRLRQEFFKVDEDNRRGCFDWSNLKYLVLDEADRLCRDVEFLHVIQKFKEAILEVEGHRVFMFSATSFDDLPHAIEILVQDPIKIEVGSEELPVRNIAQGFIEVDLRSGRTRLAVLLKLLERGSKLDEEGFKRVKRTLVFVGKKRISDSVAVTLIRSGFRCLATNGDHPMTVRMNTVEKLKQNEIDILVCTDVISRGINIPFVDRVINFNFPKSAPADYIHRLGRAARLGHVGRSISFFDCVDDKDFAYFLIKILTACGQEVPDFISKVLTDEHALYVYDAALERSITNYAGIMPRSNQIIKTAGFI